MTTKEVTEQLKLALDSLPDDDGEPGYLFDVRDMEHFETISKLRVESPKGKTFTILIIEDEPQLSGVRT